MRSDDVSAQRRHNDRVVFSKITHHASLIPSCTALFKRVSIATTTVLLLDRFSTWPSMTSHMLIYASIISALRLGLYPAVGGH